MTSLLSSAVSLLKSLAAQYDQFQSNNVSLKQLGERIHCITPAIAALETAVHAQWNTKEQQNQHEQPFVPALSSLNTALTSAGVLLEKQRGRASWMLFLTASSLAQQVDVIDQRISVAVMDLTLARIASGITINLQSIPVPSPATPLQVQASSADSAQQNAPVSSASNAFFLPISPEATSLALVPARRLVLWFDVDPKCGQLAEKWNKAEQETTQKQQQGSKGEYVPLHYMYFEKPIDLWKHVEQLNTQTGARSPSQLTDVVVAIVSSFTSPQFNEAASKSKPSAHASSNPFLTSLEMVRLIFDRHLTLGFPKPVLVSISGSEATYARWSGVSDIRKIGNRDFRDETKALLAQRGMMDPKGIPLLANASHSVPSPTPISSSVSSLPSIAFVPSGYATLRISVHDACIGTNVTGAQISLEGLRNSFISTSAVAAMAPATLATSSEWEWLGSFPSENGILTLPPLRAANYRLTIATSSSSSQGKSSPITHTAVQLRLESLTAVQVSVSMAPFAVQTQLTVERLPEASQ